MSKFAENTPKPLRHTCSRCGVLKLRTEFYKSSRSKSGLRSECILCKTEENRKKLSPESHRLKLERNYRWARKNRDRTNKYSANWNKTENGRAYRRYSSMLRVTQKLNRTPKWADLEAIKEFYKNCPKGYEVDHIIPLNGKYVSGLHVLDNLQYLPSSVNRKKNNTVELSNIKMYACCEVSYIE